MPTSAGDQCCHAVIEANQGSRNKLKYNPELRAFELHAVLPLGASVPYDFGFVPSTLGEDGDPLDILVLMDETVPVGSVVRCRLLGVIEATQQDRPRHKPIRNDRLIAVVVDTHRYRGCDRLKDVPNSVLDEIERFFVFYNKQKGVKFVALRRRGMKAARRLIAEGQRRLRCRDAGEPLQSP